MLLKLVNTIGILNFAKKISFNWLCNIFKYDIKFIMERG